MPTNHTIESLAKSLSISVSDVAYALGLPAKDIDPKTPVTAKNAASLFKAYKAAVEPESDSQRQLAGSEETEPKAKKDLVRAIASELSVSQQLVSRVHGLRLENTFNQTLSEERAGNQLKLVKQMAKSQAQKEYEAELERFSSDSQLSDIAAEYRKLEQEAFNTAQMGDEYEALLQPFKAHSGADEANALLEQIKRRDDLVAKVRGGYVPTEEELQDFTIAAAYRLYGRRN